jgi:hypothetical protein
MTTEIRVCQNPLAPQWNLGALPSKIGTTTLIGWKEAAPSGEAGVPAAVARVLAETFAEVSRVTFPCSTVKAAAGQTWSLYGKDFVRALPPKGFTAMVKNALKHQPQRIVLISTRQPPTAIRLFDDSAYPWWLQGQVVMLSQPDVAPPDITLEALLGLVSDKWLESGDGITDSGVQAIVRPGVDGDVAGLLSLDTEFEKLILAKLEGQTRRFGLAFAIVPENAFAYL